MIKLSTSSQKSIKLVNRLLFTAIFLTLCACGSNPERTMSIEGTMKATTILNPDIKGDYKPVNIKIYYLQSESEFSQANFRDLYNHTDKALGNSILHISSYQLLPGQTLELDEETPLGVKYVGVVAAFRNIDDAQWKIIKAVPEACFFCSGPGLWDPITIKLDRLKVELDMGNEP